LETKIEITIPGYQPTALPVEDAVEADAPALGITAAAGVETAGSGTTTAAAVVVRLVADRRGAAAAARDARFDELAAAPPDGDVAAVAAAGDTEPRAARVTSAAARGFFAPPARGPSLALLALPGVSPVSACATAAPVNNAAPTPTLSAPVANHADTRNSRIRRECETSCWTATTLFIGTSGSEMKTNGKNYFGDRRSPCQFR
jgi:hypothetical protein